MRFYYKENLMSGKEKNNKMVASEVYMGYITNEKSADLL